MRLKWVKDRLERWAAWIEVRKYGRVAAVSIDGMPRITGCLKMRIEELPDEEKRTQRALMALHALNPDYSEVISLVYVIGPAVHVVGVSALAEWLGMSRKTLFFRIERAEAKFAEMFEKVIDAESL